MVNLTTTQLLFLLTSNREGMRTKDMIPSDRVPYRGIGDSQPFTSPTESAQLADCSWNLHFWNLMSTSQAGSCTTEDLPSLL